MDSVESARNALKGGCARFEVCSALDLGGITPTLGLVQQVRKAVGDEAFITVLIRPRGGDFVYSMADVDVMLADVESLTTAQEKLIDGIVIGALLPNGLLDQHTCNALIECALSRRPELEITLHRAIDVASDPLAVLAACLEMKGFSRVLTSGACMTALEGVEMISKMKSAIAVAKHHSMFILAAGGGISASNAKEVLLKSNADQIHGSLRTQQQRSSYLYVPNPRISMGAADIELNKFTSTEVVINVQNSLTGPLK